MKDTNYIKVNSKQKRDMRMYIRSGTRDQFNERWNTDFWISEEKDNQRRQLWKKLDIIILGVFS